MTTEAHHGNHSGVQVGPGGRDRLPLAGRTVLVTGVLRSSSIASAVAAVAAQQGARVLLSGHPRTLAATASVARGLGLPDPVTQRPVAVDGRTYFLDLSLEEFVFDWEFDGLGKTATPEDLRAEKRRELALRRIGWDVQRFEWRELFAPERLVRRMLGLVPVGAAAAARPRRDLWL